MKSKWIEHKGKKIMFADYANFRLDMQALENEMDEVFEVVKKEPKKSVVMLVDGDNTVVTMKTLNLLKKAVLRSKPFIRKIALFDISKSKITLMHIVSRLTGTTISAFKDAEAAKEWLVQE